MDESIDIQEQDFSHEPERVLLPPEDRASIRILVIDDEPSILESCDTVLSGEGYTCQVERRAEEALRRLKAETFEVVLIDQNMPQVHGLDILIELRKRRASHSGRCMGLPAQALHGNPAPRPDR